MKRSVLSTIALPVLAGLALTGCSTGPGSGGDADLQVYTARHYQLEDAFTQFTEDTGISVEFLNGDDAELLERLKAEGESSPADVFMTVDAGALWNADQEGVLAPTSSPVLDQAVPEDLRAADDSWYGLALRGRTLVYNPEAVDPSEFDAEESYAGLTDPKWEGRLCMRDSTSAYTQSLVASLIDLYGEERTAEIVEGWVANDVDIMSNDVQQLKAIAAGGCDVGITNHYYLARELEKDPELGVELYWASQDGAGAHVNISGAGVTNTADNPEDARALLEWLATDGQSAFVDGNHELPVNPEVEAEPVAASFGDFDRMPIDAEAYGSRNAEAVALLEAAGYE
ncbi:extracellular solute-binding protein [Nocardioidaceae bacterium]|nr:extracellular solute-binding protein [Nocardioidaceae bacterium]